MHVRILTPMLFTLMFMFTAAPSVLANEGEKILDQSTKAMGGDALANVKSLVLVGSMTMAQQMTGKIEMMVKEGGKSKVKTVIQGNGMNMTAEQGCDGTNCYDSNPMMGSRILQGQEKEQFEMGNPIEVAKDWRKYYEKVEYQGKEKVGDRDTHKIFITTKAGMTMTQYIDTANHLILKNEMTTVGPMGEMKILQFYEDYKNIEGDIKFPMTTRANVMGQEMLMTFEKAEINQDIPDSMFELPPSLKAQAK